MGGKNPTRSSRHRGGSVHVRRIQSDGMVDDERVLNHPHDNRRATTHATTCCRPIHALSSDRCQAAPSETIYATMHRYHSWRWMSSSQIRRWRRPCTRTTRMHDDVLGDGRETKNRTLGRRTSRRMRSIGRNLPTCRRMQLACTGADGCVSDVIGMRSTHISGDTSRWSLRLPVSPYFLANALHPSPRRSHACFRTRLGVDGRCGRAGSRPCPKSHLCIRIGVSSTSSSDRSSIPPTRARWDFQRDLLHPIDRSIVSFRLGIVSLSGPRIERMGEEWTRTSSSNHCSAIRRHLGPPCMGGGRGHGTSQGERGEGNEA